MKGGKVNRPSKSNLQLSIYLPGFLWVMQIYLHRYLLSTSRSQFVNLCPVTRIWRDCESFKGKFIPSWLCGWEGRGVNRPEFVWQLVQPLGWPLRSGFWIGTLDPLFSLTSQKRSSIETDHKSLTIVDSLTCLTISWLSCRVFLPPSFEWAQQTLGDNLHFIYRSIYSGYQTLCLIYTGYKPFCYQ